MTSFLVMSLAQYANKNSLRDIEASLTAVSHKLYHSGISYAVPRNTLAKANENRDWRIWRDFGYELIKRVRPLYAGDPFRLDIDEMVYFGGYPFSQTGILPFEGCYSFVKLLFRYRHLVLISGI